MILYPYQSKAVNDLRSGFRHFTGQILCAPTGSGKTVMFSEIVRLSQIRGSTVLVLTDRKELFRQISNTLKAVGVTPELINAQSSVFGRSSGVFVCMVETLARREHILSNLSPDLMIIDECFVSTTLVDGSPISKLKIGDYVNSYNHELKIVERKKVSHIFKKKMNIDETLIRINYLYGVIECTKEHPVFIKNKGYVRAIEVKENDEVLLYDLRKGNDESKHIKSKMAENKRKRKFNHLFGFMYIDFTVKKNDFKKSNVESGNKDENDRIIKTDRSQAKNTGREWKGYDYSSENIIGFAWRWMVSRISNNYRKWLFTISLQSRYWKSRIKNNGGNRWWKSLFIKGKGIRSKKNGTIRVERVQSVEILEYTDNGEFGDGYKYNLEVDGNNNYFANGILVHNCHKGNFNKIIDLFPTVPRIGATATPIGKHIPIYYQSIVQTIDVPDLVDAGFLVRCRSFQMQDDFSDLRKKMGEFTDKSQFDHFNKPKLYDGVITNYRDRYAGKKAICFNVNIKHTKSMHQAFMDAGIKSACITSKTPDAVRDAILQEYHEYQGEFVLNNCGVLTTGYDEPTIECVILNRATDSLALYLQMIGRGSRLSSGKEEFGVLDFGGNISRHGLWSQPRNWTLDQNKRKKSDKLDVFPVKTCPKCSAMLMVLARVCEFCGQEFDMDNKKLVNGVLVEVEPDTITGKLMSELTVPELYALSKQKRDGFSSQYIWRVIRSRGSEAVRDYGILAGYSNGWYRMQIDKLEDSNHRDRRII